MKYLFESDEEAREFFEIITSGFDPYFATVLIKATKKKGYIKPSALEKARMEYSELPDHKATSREAENYITELEKEIKRLKGE